jgi:aldehyde dehydrogenase (NAD+)
MISAPAKSKTKKSATNHAFLKALKIKSLSSGANTGTEWLNTSGKILESYSPVDGKLIGSVKQASQNDYEKVMLQAEHAFKQWRLIPAPRRGEIVRQNRR